AARVPLHVEHVERERPDGRERREGEGAAIEEDVVQRLAPSAPLDCRRRNREGEGHPRSEQRRAGDRPDGADGDRAEIELEREGLTRAYQRDDRHQAADVVAGPEDEACDPCRTTDQADQADDGREALREGEESRTVSGVRARLAALVRGVGLNRPRYWHLVIAVVRNCDE